MLPYIDLIVSQNETKPGVSLPSGDRGADGSSRVQFDGDAADIELSFDPKDPECIARVPVYVFDQAGTVEGAWLATSIRGRVQVNSGVTLQNVMAYINKIEKLAVDGEWQDSNYPQIQTTWTDTNDILTNIPGQSVRYFNVLHINHPDNRISIWKRSMLSASLADFVKDVTTYRITVSITVQKVTRNLRIEIDWKGNWDTIQVRSA